MTNNAEDPKNENNGHDGFVWSQRLTVLAGFGLALALAAARFAPILAAPLIWRP
jgi:hypothetical protein